MLSNDTRGRWSKEYTYLVHINMGLRGVHLKYIRIGPIKSYKSDLDILTLIFQKGGFKIYVWLKAPIKAAMVPHVIS